MTEVISSIRGTSRLSQWLVPAGLILLSLIPIAAGAARLGELTGGVAITPQNARFFASPVPVVVHIVSASVYCVLGALQFVSSLRRTRPRWHRIAGRILVPAGLLAALSGLWMTLFYPRPEGDGEVLLVVRLIFGSAMAVSIVLAVLAIRRRDIPQHSAWMTRGYAIAMGAGTQVLTHVPWILLFGVPDELPRTVLMAAGWVINVVVAEYVIYRRAHPSSRTSRVSGRSRTADALLS
jgi:uncharacterized membrane protein